MFIFKIYLQLTSAIAYLHSGFYRSEGSSVDHSVSKVLRPHFLGILHRDIKVIPSDYVSPASSADFGLTTARKHPLKNVFEELIRQR